LPDWLFVPPVFYQLPAIVAIVRNLCSCSCKTTKQFVTFILPVSKDSDVLECFFILDKHSKEKSYGTTDPRGEAGFIIQYLLKEVRPDTDALSPGNKLIFAMGPLSGIALGGASRHAVGAKSPLTGGIAKAEAGEWWGAQFK
jgi:hypothetical protein